MDDPNKGEDLDKPGDLVTLEVAGRAVDRSRDTVRRWVRSGALRRWEGEVPPHGGSPPALVSLAEVHRLAVVGELEVAPPRRGPGGQSSSPASEPGHAEELHALRLELQRERHRVELAELRAELARVTAERDALERERSAARSDLADARAERDRWREVAEAATAERNALATIARVPFWRRLLGG